MTVCLDDECPVHTNHQPDKAVEPPPSMPPAPEEETEEGTTQRKAEHEQRMAEYEAEQGRREKQREARLATFERILEHAPASFNAAQMRFFLRLLIHLDYSFLEDVATHFVNADENSQQSDEEIVLAALDDAADEKLTRLALRLVLSERLGIPREGQLDLLGEAEQEFAPKKAKAVRAKVNASSKAKPAAVKASPKKEAARKKAA
jgi:ParB family chromosome partitioning protein